MKTIYTHNHVTTESAENGSTAIIKVDASKWFSYKYHLTKNLLMPSVVSILENHPKQTEFFFEVLTGQEGLLKFSVDRSSLNALGDCLHWNKWTGKDKDKIKSWIKNNIG